MVLLYSCQEQEKVGPKQKKEGSGINKRKHEYLQSSYNKNVRALAKTLASSSNNKKVRRSIFQEIQKSSKNLGIEKLFSSNENVATRINNTFYKTDSVINEGYKLTNNIPYGMVLAIRNKKNY